MTKRTESKHSIIKRHLTQAIRLRQFKHRLPSENALAEKFEVSRMTARKVLIELEIEGLVKRVQGSGTFIRERDFGVGTFTIHSSQKHAATLQAEHSVEILDVRLIATPTAEVIEKLNYTQQLILIRRLHHYNGQPVRYEISYLRDDLCGGMLWESLEEASIDDLLVNKYGLHFSRAWQRVTAVVMADEIAGLFQVAAGYPAFHIERLTFTDEKPVSLVEYYIRGEVGFEDVFSPTL